MQTFKIKSPMENTYETIGETIENGHDVNFLFNYDTGVCVEVSYDDVFFECFYGKKAYVTPSMINITDESESIIIPLSKVKLIKIRRRYSIDEINGKRSSKI